MSELCLVQRAGHTSSCRWMTDGLPCSFWLTIAGFPSSLFPFSGPTFSLWRQTQILHYRRASIVVSTWGICTCCTRQSGLYAFLDLYWCSLQWRAAPWASPCRRGAVDHRETSQTNRTATGWGRASPSPRRKQCVQFHMKPRTKSRLLPPVLDASAPMGISKVVVAVLLLCYYVSLYNSLDHVFLSRWLIPGRWEMRVCTTHLS